MRIEFDEAKRAETIKARGLDMARTAEVFAGSTVTGGDYGEVRHITIGFWTKRWWYSSGRAATMHTGSSA